MTSTPFPICQPVLRGTLTNEFSSRFFIGILKKAEVLISAFCISDIWIILVSSCVLDVGFSTKVLHVGLYRVLFLLIQ